jgi:hypothetical protein
VIGFFARNLARMASDPVTRGSDGGLLLPVSEGERGDGSRL